MVHPSYTASSLTFLERLGTIYGIHGRPLPEHARFNRQRIYDQLKRTTDRTGSFHPVQGMDWPYLPPDPGTGAHAAAAVLLGDPDAACLERRALTTLEARQQGNQGRLYDRSIAEQVHDIQDPLIVRESAIAGPAYTYLLHRLGGDGPRPTPEDDLERQLRGVRVYPHSGFVFHRHRAGQTSLAWRNIVMALPLDQGGIYTVAPAANSFLASVRVEDRADSQDLVSAEVETQDHSFAAALVLDRAQGSVRQEVLFAGLPDGRSLCWERLTARQRLTVESLQQGFLRIVNEHFARLQGNCDGFRILHTPAGKERFPGYVDPDPQSDQVRTYDHPAWVAVDDRLGLIFQGTGPTVYTNRHYFPTWWAVADDLVLSRLDRPFRAQPGAVIGQLATLIAPGRTARQTAGLQLLEPRAPRRAAGLLAGNYLAAANFDQKGRRIALSVPRANFDQKDRRIDLAAPHARLDPVPVFAGTAKITPRAVTYTLALGPGAATLRPALMTLSVEGEVEIVAAETGRVLARNTGDKTAAVTVGRGKETVRLQPETAVSLR